MALLLVLHVVVGTTLLVVGRRLGPKAPWVGLLAPAAVVAWLLVRLPGVLDGDVTTGRTTWVPSLGLALDLRLDGFAAALLVLVSGIGVAVFAYAARYLDPAGHDVGRLLGLLVLFSGAMVGLVLADDLFVLYGFWELTSITSFLLIGNAHAEAEARAAALHALLVTGAGGLAMLTGFVLLGQAAGTYRLSELVAAPPTGPLVGPALVLVLLGAFTKSAQVPFHSWLPGAMVAPTPISAYLHSATMVKAGVYLIARLSPAFADQVGWWRPVVVGVGLATLLHGGVRALRHHDLKVLLAYGTVSQLGLLVATFGLGTPEALAAGTAMLLAHGAFKATGFLSVGILDHQYGTRDLRHLPRPDRTWRLPIAVALVGAASMAGLPPLLGFVAKEEVLAAFRSVGTTGSALALAAVVAGSALTAAYSLRFAWGLLGRGATRPVDRRPADVRPPLGFVAPGAALALATVVLGLAPGLLDGLVGAATRSLAPGAEAHGVHLALWHGANLPLLLSALALAGGGALFLARRRVGAALAAGRHLPEAGDAYVGVLRGLNAGADRLTGFVQRGSLPVYAGVILLTSAVLPLWALTTGPSWAGWPDLVETPAHVPVAIALVGAALAASVVRRRFSAALFLGVVGYAMAALFVVQGAPDLALTQVAIETLSTVLFVLVLRRLPDRFGPSWGDRRRGGDGRGHGEGAPDHGAASASPMSARQRAARVAVAAAVGTSVFVLALVMGTGTTPTPTSDAMVERALPEGHGRNVVNVILVDIRGFDTLGEITVLACAAIGTVALARAGRRPAGSTASTGQADRTDGPAGGTGPQPEAIDRDRTAPGLRTPRMVTLDVSVRVVFPALMVGSVYLLFAGHNQPGGGFVGGILAGAAVAVRYLAGGIDDVRRLSRARPWTVLGAGLVVAVGTATAPLVGGGHVLQSGYTTLDLPLVGSVSLTSAALFDVGVYLAVLGLALMVFESFGDDPVARAPSDAPGHTPGTDPHPRAADLLAGRAETSSPSVEGSPT